MGRERKRGALEDLVAVLTGDTRPVPGPVGRRPTPSTGITYVLTLDADTVLPRDAARKLVATIAHPLNRASIDDERRVVDRGYGLIQPRVAMSLPAASRSRFARLFSGVTGVDPYGGTASDVYQDAFGEGSFTGKGIFEVARVPRGARRTLPRRHAALARPHRGQLPAHRLRERRRGLRRPPGDLPERRRATAPLGPRRLADRPLAGADRAHRDGPRAQPAHGRAALEDPRQPAAQRPARRHARCSSPWAWRSCPAARWLWPVGLLLIVFFPVYMHLFDSLVMHPRGVTLRSSLTHARRATSGATSMRGVVRARDAARTRRGPNLDAVARALWRSFVSHRHMLEWTTAAEAEGAYARGALVRLRPPDRPVGGASACVLLVPAAVARARRTCRRRLRARRGLAHRPGARPLDEPAAASRAAASRPRRSGCSCAASRARPGASSRRSSPSEDRWLAPDNFQEDPKGEIAHRTSPDEHRPAARGVPRRAGTSGYATLPGLRAARRRGRSRRWRASSASAATSTTGTTRATLDAAAARLRVHGGQRQPRRLPARAAGRPARGVRGARSSRPSTLDGVADTVRLALEDLGRATRGARPEATRCRELRRDARGDRCAARSSREPPHVRRRLVLAARGARAAGRRRSPRSATACPRRVARRRGAATPAASLDDVAVHRDAGPATLDPDVRCRGPPSSTTRPAIVRAEPYDDVLVPVIDFVPSLVGLAEGLVEVHARARRPGRATRSGRTRRRASRWPSGRARCATSIEAARPAAAELLATLRLMADIAREMWEHTDFGMLYDPSRGLFSIGYNTAEGRLDPSFYDLLASECRLASFLAIAKDDVPQSHWFRLGRTLASTGSGYALVSLVGVDVRVPHAAARHAQLPRHAAGRDVRSRWCAARSSTAPSAACRGACPSPRSTPRTPSSPTSTRRSACPGWA